VSDLQTVRPETSGLKESPVWFSGLVGRPQRIQFPRVPDAIRAPRKREYWSSLLPIMESAAPCKGNTTTTLVMPSAYSFMEVSPLALESFEFSYRNSPLNADVIEEPQTVMPMPTLPEVNNIHQIEWKFSLLLDTINVSLVFDIGLR